MMEFTNRRSNRQLRVPSRGSAQTQQPSLPISNIKSQVDIPSDLAAERARHGFDDVLGEDELLKNVGIRTLLLAWIKQIIKREKSGSIPTLKEYVKETNQSTRDSLKYAIAADLDEIPKPKPKAVNKAQHTKTIDININLGSVPKLPRFSFQKLKPLQAKLTRRRTIALLVCIILVTGVITSLPLLKNHGTQTTKPTPALTNVNGELTKGTPDYETILPAGRTIKDFGGWTRVSPPERNPVFAYVDRIGGIPVNVSQQPLPYELSEQPTEQLKVLAVGYRAERALDANGTTIYVGTSAKGPQSIIFTKQKLLILIKAQAQVQDKDIIDYVNSLQ